MPSCVFVKILFMQLLSLKVTLIFVNDLKKKMCMFVCVVQIMSKLYRIDKVIHVT